MMLGFYVMSPAPDVSGELGIQPQNKNPQAS